jgi:hypothetical protein
MATGEPQDLPLSSSPGTVGHPFVKESFRGAIWITGFCEVDAILSRMRPSRYLAAGLRGSLVLIPKH